MHVIKVLGSGCASCKRTAERLEKIARELDASVEVVKVEELSEIMGYGVMATPGVVIDERVVHAGGVPSALTIRGWLAELS
ncbi:MAG: thioredoxin family protein [Deltaproteobacteria bacterium HGW-Deltaproteobacteria-14]|jgi:small redox-active disulfide protein 2|nr:MAG: thioredoxin family protein [Deltaproteobacteria bacterium HGW-Deltaproteobacteria-14]